MTTYKEVEKQAQHLARCERDLALEKIKRRRADTRRKIELGGLVIKSGMDAFEKSILLGSLNYILELISKEPSYKDFFKSKGDGIFLNPAVNYNE